MDMIAVLPLGFLIGMGHALEADHLAAVATMLDSRASRFSAMLRGAFWGLGHTLALFAICTAVVLFGLTISGRVEAALEMTVGLMIVALGAQLLWTLRRNRVRLQSHSHGASHDGGNDGREHLHLLAGNSPAPHPHVHRGHRANLKAMTVGLMHGAAGSAGLLVLVVASTSSLSQAMGYFAIFGLGSILGMAAISLVASYPLHLLHRGGVWMRGATGAAIAAGAFWVGGSLAWQGYAAMMQPGL